jgi:hypothetical protein
MTQEIRTSNFWKDLLSAALIQERKNPLMRTEASKSEGE